jgi:hypothetical protein
LGGGLAGAQVLRILSNPGVMTITTAVAGSNPTSVTDATSTYRARTNIATNKLKITAHLSAVMPPGLSLAVALAPTTGGVSNGSVVLGTAPLDLMGPITNTANQTNTITYTLSSTPAAGVVALSSRIVTYTLVAWP